MKLNAFLPMVALIPAALFSMGCSSEAKPSLPASGWTLEKKGATWQSTGFEEDMDLSGIASIDGRNVLLGSDELLAAQAGVLDPEKRTITGGDFVPLLKNASGKKMEVDIEGVAVSRKDHLYFVTGSHGVGKKNGEYEESRATVFQIACDPETGALLPDSVKSASLMPWLLQSPVFKDYTKKPLQLNGFNIEGLTFHDGKLFFGTRGPNVQGKTYVIETTPASLFGGGLPECKVHELAIGETRGIRGMVALRDGFLLLTGNASAEATKKFPVSQTRMADKVFDVLLWRPGQTPEVSSVGVLPRPLGKAESALLLEDGKDHVDLLVLFDGAPGGGPTAYRLTRP